MAFKFKAKEFLGATGTFSEKLTISGVSVLTGINIDTGSFVTTGQTGAFITTGQTGAFVTTGQTGIFVTTGQTGSFLTTSSNVVYATGNQTISGVKTFNDQTNFSTGVSAAGDFEITNSFNGIVLKSPNGSRYRITVDNDGALRTNLITEVVMGVGGDGPILGVGGDAISPVS